VPRSAIRTRLNEFVALVERHPVRWAGILLAVFLAANCFWRDVSQFGQFHDDTLYFSSAKALAEGRGYIIPSLPGTPYQTKYPILYPWLLSWVWRVDPEFPGNLRWAYLQTALFGAGFVAGCFALARSLGYQAIVALLIAAACALQPMTQLLSAAVLSDIPFMAFAVWAMALSARWLDESDVSRRRRLFAAAAALLALAILTRTIGVGLALGIVAAAVMRRAWREGVLFALITGGVAAISMGWSQTHQLAPNVLAGAAAGFRQTLLFYTGYAGFWRESVPDAGLLGAMILRNSAVGVLEIGLMVFGELLRAWGAPLTLLPMALGAAILWSVFRRRGDGYQPVHFVFVSYCVIVALWNYPLAGRLLPMFLPLFFAGAYRLFADCGRATLHAARSGALAERAAGAVGLIALAGLALSAAYSHLWHGPRAFYEMRESRRQVLSDRLAAYSWIAENTPPDARIVSYEDVLLYLHTGRQGMRPLQLTGAPSYDPGAYPIAGETARMADTAKAIASGYWLVSEGDWSAEEASMVDGLRAAARRAVKPCPIAAEFGRSAVIRRMDEGRCGIAAIRSHE
jgi:4-amino-4-deoxy-L-arabinose transferase-like glycosyltransferase